MNKKTPMKNIALYSLAIIDIQQAYVKHSNTLNEIKMILLARKCL